MVVEQRVGLCLDDARWRSLLDNQACEARTERVETSQAVAGTELS